MTDADNDWQGYLRMLIYGVQFSKDPIPEADRIIQSVITKPGESPEVYLNAIKKGLVSKEKLAELIPQDHPEDIIRDFLVEIARKLEKLTPKK